MSYPKLATLVKKLWKKTVAGKVKWEITTTDGIYQSVFPGFTIKIYKYTLNSEPFICIKIFNEEGELIEEVNDSELKNFIDEPSYDLMLEMYDTARRIAMGTEQGIDAILKVLDEDDEFSF